MALIPCGGKAPEATAPRPALDAVLPYVREGETVIGWRVDRLDQVLKHCIEVMTALAVHGIGYRPLTEQFETTPPDGKLAFRSLVRSPRTNETSRESALAPTWLPLESENASGGAVSLTPPPATSTRLTSAPTSPRRSNPVPSRDA